MRKSTEPGEMESSLVKIALCNPAPSTPVGSYKAGQQAVSGQQVVSKWSVVSTHSAVVRLTPGGGSQAA